MLPPPPSEQSSTAIPFDSVMEQSRGTPPPPRGVPPPPPPGSPPQPPGSPPPAAARPRQRVVPQTSFKIWGSGAYYNAPSIATSN